MKRVAIVGLGLIGGSLGLALRRNLPEVEVVGVARRPETAVLARRRRAVHRAGTALEGVAGADLVVLACPLDATESVLRHLAPHLDPGARVTDVGSVKLPVNQAAARLLNGKRNPFLGGHPMAGKEVSGLENAEPGLFTGKPWVFTGRPGRKFEDLWQAVEKIGAHPVTVAAEEHDRSVALVSHIPFLLSAAYLVTAGRDSGWRKAALLASSGFRDISRLGAGDPAMYAAIVEANRDAVLDAWAELHRALDELEADLARVDHGGLKQLFTEARRVRAGWEKRQRGVN